MENISLHMLNSSSTHSDHLLLTWKYFFYSIFLVKRNFIWVDSHTWEGLEKKLFLIYSNQLQDIKGVKFFSEFDIFKYSFYSEHSIFSSTSFFMDEKTVFFFFFININQYIFSFFCINFFLIILFDSLFFYEIFSFFFNKSYYFFFLDFYLKIRTMVASKLKYSLRELIQTVKFSYVVQTFFIIFIFNLSNLIPEFSSLSSYILYIFFFTFIIILNLFTQIFKVYLLASLKKFKNIDSNWYGSLYPCIMALITFFFRILSLCIRLFVNMLAGHLLIGMIQHFIYLSFFFWFFSNFFKFLNSSSLCHLF